MSKPAMMAIGDSLFNGVRSLTINQQLAQWSAPAQVARALGIPFANPDYPRNVVINFEQWLRDFPVLVSVATDVESNVAFWDQRPKSALTAFDNIAIASSTYADMFKRTWQTADAEIKQLHGSLGVNFGKIGANLADLFFAFNTRFLLNPTSDSAAPAKTSLQIVEERKPARLLVSIGHNNGLWEMGFAAEASTGHIGDPNPTRPFNQQDLLDQETFVDGLKALPAEVKHIYVNALPMPSCVADMMPVPDDADMHKPGAGNYYATYENRFGFNYATLTAQQMAANDAVVKAMNTRLVTLAAADPRIHAVPIDTAFTAYDFKTDPNAKTVNVGGKVLSNLMVEGPGLLFPDFWRGGLMGLDGMHPTIVGYTIMAQEILTSIAQHEGVNAVKQPDVTLAYQADTLLQKVPFGWDPVLDLSLDIRRASAATHGTAVPTGQKYDAVAGILKAIDFKYD